MPSYDPFALLRLLNSMRSTLAHPTAPWYVLTVGIASTLVLSYVKPNLTPVDVVIAIACSLFVLWIGRHTRTSMRHRKEVKKIYANRHRGDRLRIQRRCRQLVGIASEYRGRTVDDVHELHITLEPGRIGSAYRVSIIEYELYGIDIETHENLYSYAVHTYIINPQVCAIRHHYTFEVCDNNQALGEGNTLTQSVRTMNWLEVDDITFITESLQRSFVPARDHSAGTET